ncbi:E3 ubiquitin/ISG15 ligase TRIM25-like [Scomber japonicus]|uniref:E3 ubiquitin/ISG15 ligase TRIM25-like n=1 Tax=Scomber japonicus TaxID=13676 RepID=UPI0023067D0F|nr:E3 ubiquitin/ISG15 ligase TRIM25-like [Scomber japonicus]
MAQKDQLDLETISCSICLDLLKDPVTIPCGHSYCMSCIKGFWDGEDQRKIYSCPQCREAFTPRPVLKKSTMFAALVEQLKKTGLQAAPADHCYAGPEDVACDVCTGRKLKAFKSCLQCLASYCKNHLQSHYESPTFKKHKLVEPSKKLQANICSRHDEVMKIFCRTDKKCICYLCTMEDHKGHDTVPAAAERTERQRELEVSRLNIQQRIQHREKDVKLLQQEVKAVSRSADKAVEDSEKIFTELIRLLQKRSSDVKQQIRSQQETEVSRVKELEEKLQQEITELKRKDTELKQLSHTEDHNQFLHNYPSVSQLSEPTDSSSINIRPLRYFEDVTAAVSELRDKLQDILRDKWTNISLTVAEVDILLPQPEPKTRAGFLKYLREITLDPNTAHTELLLSEGNRKVEWTYQQQSYFRHRDRFTNHLQVLSRESLTGRCYWEVERRGWGVFVAVAYKNISRSGEESEFGRNDKSWSLYCSSNSYDFWFNNIKTTVSGPGSSRVGVYLDHRAGILSFYSVSKTMTLLHRVQTTFTQPLYAGLLVSGGATAELCKAAFMTESHDQIKVQTCFIYQEVKLRQSLPLRAEMAQKDQLDLETISCSICLDLLKDPVTIPCGHSYCMSCIKGFWDGEDQRKIYSCPQCREAFTPRPVLKKSTMFAALVEQLKKTGLQAAPADHCYAGPEDVACDVCTGRKLKAIKSCLQCLASYCKNHLQSHFESPTLKKHKLVEPSKKLQENICSRHDEVMKIFCRTDKKCICYLCTMEDHKGHDTVPAAAERTRRQRELEVSRLNIQQRIQHREKDVKLLQQEVKAVSRSADKAVEDSERIFTELIRLLQKRSSDVKQQIRSQQETEMRRVKELQEKLQQEITELKRKDAELTQLSHTEDHNQFLHNYPSVSQLSEHTDSSSINIRPLRHFEDVTAAVSELRDKLQDILRDKWINISQTGTEVDVLLSQPEPEPEPKTRAEFLKYSREITLDPNIANTRLLLSEGNRKVTYTLHPQSYSRHTDRFTDQWQVLSRESLTGRCYWEVERRAGALVYVAVAYKNISRAGSQSLFGCNDKSWSLDCYPNRYGFRFNNIETPVSGPRSSRVGVYLDHRAGILSFYSVSETMTLLHRVQTTFTQPLYAGLCLYNGATAELRKLKETEVISDVMCRML